MSKTATSFEDRPSPMEAAMRASRGDDEAPVFPLPDRPARPRPVAPVAAESSADAEIKRIEEEATRRAHKAAVLRALARTVVSLAMEAGGQDPRHWRPADTLTAENVERMLTDVMDAKAVELPSAFRFASYEDDFAKATKVAAAVSGGA